MNIYVHIPLCGDVHKSWYLAVQTDANGVRGAEPFPVVRQQSLIVKGLTGADHLRVGNHLSLHENDAAHQDQKRSGSYDQQHDIVLSFSI
tara:strand:- start:2348 stop:2617 length:270 start_codon:yes stop_codon:yes gene_type:complete